MADEIAVIDMWAPFVPTREIINHGVENSPKRHSIQDMTLCSTGAFLVSRSPADWLPR